MRRSPSLTTVALTGAMMLLLTACGRREPGIGTNAASTTQAAAEDPARFWNAATIYFLLTDRFVNGDPSNDPALGRVRDGAMLRNFEGGDLPGILRKLQDGYFDSLGVTALWFTPFVEQIHGSTDEGTGRTYGYHGYWTRDWTAVDPALGTADDLRSVVAEAHRRGIRVLMDAVINHTGPVTADDPAWPGDWVRTAPRCRYQDYVTTVECTLVDNLPDIRTDSDAPVDLPPSLVEKWRQEGRLDQEIAELDAFFSRTGHPRAPRWYIIKWLTDWVREYGFDGYRVDTAKHFEPAVSAELKLEAERAFQEWKGSHPEEVLDDRPFYMMGEVYNYDLAMGREFSFGDSTVDFYANGYDGLINFGFKGSTTGSLESLFAPYATALTGGPLQGVAVLNYASSHDDGSPYDRERLDPMGTATRLLLAPGGAQIYYGDELARPLRITGAEGDANLRSMMNWADLEAGGRTAEILRHWRILGRFRQAHPAVGAGVHQQLQADPYVFSRILELPDGTDRVVVGLDPPEGSRTIPVAGVFPDGTELVDAYSGATGLVRDGRVTLATGGAVVLLSQLR